MDLNISFIFFHPFISLWLFLLFFQYFNELLFNLVIALFTLLVAFLKNFSFYKFNYS